VLHLVQQNTFVIDDRYETGTFAYELERAEALTVVPCRAESTPERALAMEPTLASAAVDFEPHVDHESFTPA
jgi:hypothetical protein